MSRFFAILLMLALSGCAYQLGPTGGQVAGYKSVQVNLFQNNTFEPRLSEPISISLRRAIQQDGTFKLATHGGADVVIQGEITEFQRSALSFQPADVLTVRDYTLSIRAMVRAIDLSSGKTLWESPFFGRTTIRVGSDLASAEREAVPLMAEDMAQNITAHLVDGKW